MARVRDRTAPLEALYAARWDGSAVAAINQMFTIDAWDELDVAPVLVEGRPTGIPRQDLPRMHLPRSCRRVRHLGIGFRASASETAESGECTVDGESCRPRRRKTCAEQQQPESPSG